MAAKDAATGVDGGGVAYLSEAPEDGQQGYARIRALVHARAGERPVAERLSYKIPTFFVDGKRLLHVGVWGDYLAIYPIPVSTTDSALSEELARHVEGKGTLHFRYAEEWPGDLIERVVLAHVERLG